MLSHKFILFYLFIMSLIIINIVNIYEFEFLSAPLN